MRVVFKHTIFESNLQRDKQFLKPMELDFVPTPTMAFAWEIDGNDEGLLHMLENLLIRDGGIVWHSEKKELQVITKEYAPYFEGRCQKYIKAGWLTSE